MRATRYVVGQGNGFFFGADAADHDVKTMEKRRRNWAVTVNRGHGKNGVEVGDTQALGETLHFVGRVLGENAKVVASSVGQRGVFSLDLNMHAVAIASLHQLTVDLDLCIVRVLDVVRRAAMDPEKKNNIFSLRVHAFFFFSHE